MPYYYLDIQRLEGVGPFDNAKTLIEECPEDESANLVLFIDDNGLITSVVEYAEFVEALEVVEG